MSSMDYLLIFQDPSIVLLLGTICILLLSFYKILIPFEEIVLTPPNDKDKLYHLLSVKESEKIIKDFEKDKQNIQVSTALTS